MSAERPVAGAILEIDMLPLGPIGTNCYVVREAGSEQAIVVDPGGDVDRLVELLDERALGVEAIFVTHCHWDHIGAVAALGAHTGAPVWMSAIEAPVLEDPSKFPMGGPMPIEPWPVEHRLDGGERIEVAGIAFDVLHVPGHSPGHLAFVAPGIRDASGDGYETPPVCLIGDVIFQGSIGRTDLPFADSGTLMQTLSMLKVRLDPETALLPGHGGTTTMAAELRSNPFLRG